MERRLKGSPVVALLGISIPSATLGWFWSMLAHYHAQVWNGSELARA